MWISHLNLNDFYRLILFLYNDMTPKRFKGYIRINYILH